MLQSFTKLKNSVLQLILPCFVLISLSFISCNKPNHPPSPENYNASVYPSDVIDKWITLQLRLMRDATGIPNNVFSRYYAYSGIAAYESVAPGTRDNDLAGVKWNGLTNLPRIDKFKIYFWPASANTALAFMNRSIFTTANAADKAAIDSLEAALNASFIGIDSTVIIQSNAFGKVVANSIFSWSETDGYKNASAPYTPPVGTGLWVPTPPALATATTPYWGNNRTIVEGSNDNTQPGPPPFAYSESPKSEFYQMVQQLYNASLNLTPDQTAMAIFWKDFPGATSPGHWLSILQQVIKQTGSHLDKTAWAYAFSGACLNDAGISCFKTKYTFNQVRPITYIRNIMGITGWNPLITTPSHPEYSAAHATISAAAADALTSLFGNIGSFTDHTYDYLGFAPRTFNSFKAIGIDAGNSRLYGGIHYQPSIDTGLIQGRKVTANIVRIFSIK